MKPAIFTPDADREYTEAALFYEGRVEGLGLRFMGAVEAAVLDIREHPRRWPVVRGKTRRRLLARFPYGLLYREDADEIVIQAVMHLHRRPDYWYRRG
jgi:hypothetical protein